MIAPTTDDAAASPSLLADDQRSRLQRRRDERRSIVTAELALPATVAHEVISERAPELRCPELVAVNITDDLRERPALPPIAAAAILSDADLGIEPVLRSRPVPGRGARWSRTSRENRHSESATSSM